MGKKEKDKSRTKEGLEELRQQGLKLYLAKTSITSISKTLGISRKTVGIWRAKYDWDKKKEEASREVREFDGEIKKSVQKAIFDDLVPEYKEVANSLRVINNIVTQKIWARDKAGRILRDEEGRPQVNDKIPPKDLHHLSNIVSSNLKAMKLLAGESTENIENNHTGRIEHEHTHDIRAPFETFMHKMKTGEVDAEKGQKLLADLAIAMQNVQEALHG